MLDSLLMNLHGSIQRTVLVLTLFNSSFFRNIFCAWSFNLDPIFRKVILSPIEGYPIGSFLLKSLDYKKIHLEFDKILWLTKCSLEQLIHLEILFFFSNMQMETSSTDVFQSVTPHLSPTRVGFRFFFSRT